MSGGVEGAYRPGFPRASFLVRLDRAARVSASSALMSLPYEGERVDIPFVKGSAPVKSG
jgi:hypothetical protein